MPKLDMTIGEYFVWRMSQYDCKRTEEWFHALDPHIKATWIGPYKQYQLDPEGHIAKYTKEHKKEEPRKPARIINN